MVFVCCFIKQHAIFMINWHYMYERTISHITSIINERLVSAVLPRTYPKIFKYHTFTGSPFLDQHPMLNWVSRIRNCKYLCEIYRKRICSLLKYFYKFALLDYGISYALYNMHLHQNLELDSCYLMPQYVYAI